MRLGKENSLAIDLQSKIVNLGVLIRIWNTLDMVLYVLIGECGMAGKLCYGKSHEENDIFA